MGTVLGRTDDKAPFIIMKIAIIFPRIMMLDVDCSREEFIMNFSNQVPHWDFMTDEEIRCGKICNGEWKITQGL